MRTINYHQRIFKEKAENKREELGKRPDWLKVRLP
ncbi:MAG: lipoyl synthase, partial [Ignavibacteria bacterium CG08_land_8_20_14_0_20_37_9]